MPEYKFQNQVGQATAWARIEAELGNLSREYGLTVEKVSPTSVRLKRTGVDVLATVSPSEVVVAVDLSFVLRPIGGKIERQLNERIPPLLRG